MVCFGKRMGKICSSPQQFLEVMPVLIQRQQYLEKLIKKQNNGRVKIITGLRRCGKSFLLFELYANYLRDSGVGEDQIIGLALDELPNARYRNPMELDKVIRERICDPKKPYYVMIDEIQRMFWKTF